MLPCICAVVTQEQTEADRRKTIMPYVTTYRTRPVLTGLAARSRLSRRSRRDVVHTVRVSGEAWKPVCRKEVLSLDF